MTQDIPLDERGLEAAHVAFGKAFGPYSGKHMVGVDAAIRAYLQTAAADVSGLVDRLHHRKLARIAANSRHAKADGALDNEAASTLQTLSARNAALEAENGRLRGDMQRIIDAPLIDHSDPNNNPASIARAALSALPSSPAEGEKL